MDARYVMQLTRAIETLAAAITRELDELADEPRYDAPLTAIYAATLEIQGHVTGSGADPTSSPS